MLFLLSAGTIHPAWGLQPNSALMLPSCPTFFLALPTTSGISQACHVFLPGVAIA